MAASSIDDVRLLRAIANYRVVAGDHRCVVVDGGSEPHTVYLREDDACDCGDWTFRDDGPLCVHLLAALLWAEEDRVVVQLGRVMRSTWLERPPPPPRAEYVNGVRVA